MTGERIGKGRQALWNNLKEKDLLDFILIQYYNKNNDAEANICCMWQNKWMENNPLSSHLP